MELLRKKFGEDFKEYWQEGYEGFYGNLQKEPGHVIRNEEYFTLGKSIFYRGSYELRREREWERRSMTYVTKVYGEMEAWKWRKISFQCKQKKIVSILVNAIPVLWKILERGNWWISKSSLNRVNRVTWAKKEDWWSCSKRWGK